MTKRKAASPGAETGRAAKKRRAPSPDDPEKRKDILHIPPETFEAGLTWKFQEQLYERGDMDDEIWCSLNSLYVATDSANRTEHHIVAKRTIWNPHMEKASQEFENTKNAVGHVAVFPIMKGMHKVHSYHISELDLDEYKIKDPDEYESLSDTEKDIRRRDVGRAPCLRQYMVWSRFKSLDKLVKVYERMEPKVQIPEPFIWIVVYNVATALHYVLTGGLEWTSDYNVGARGTKEFQALIHCDVKPGNIFLSKEQSPYDSYPNPELGDWDSALQVGRWNPAKTDTGRGDPQYRAPENRSIEEIDVETAGLDDPDTLPFPDLTTKSDIWSLGLVIWELMNSTLSSDERYVWIQRVAEHYDYTNLQLGQEHDTTNASYTKHLHNLRDRCLIIDPNHRITPHEIAVECKRNLETLLPNTLGNFSNGHISNTTLLLKYGQDQFNETESGSRRVSESE